MSYDNETLLPQEINAFENTDLSASPKQNKNTTKMLPLAS